MVSAGKRLLLVLGLMVSLLTPNAHADVVKSLVQNWHQEVYGDFLYAGNGVVQCAEGDAECAKAVARTTKQPAGDFPLQWSDVDSDPTTFDSSTSQVTVPPGAKIAFARLSWGGSVAPGCAQPPGEPAKQAVRFSVGGAASTTVPPASYAEDDEFYSAYADVTSKFAGVATGKPVDLGAANIWTKVGRGCSGGWSVALVYAYPQRDPQYAPEKRAVYVYDGHLHQRSTDPDATTTITGFRAASADAHVGVTAYGGDWGTKGDQFLLDGSPVAEPATGAQENFFVANAENSKRPALTNNFGVDAKSFNSAAVAVGADDAKLSFRSRGDDFVAANLAFSAPVPDLRVATHAEPARAHAGEQVAFTVAVTNPTGLEARDVTATDGDFPSCDKKIGTLAAGAVTSYQCTVTAPDDDFTATTKLTGTSTFGDAIETSTTSRVDVAHPAITLTQHLDKPAYHADDPVTITLTTTNPGDVPLHDVTLTLPNPATTPPQDAATEPGPPVTPGSRSPSGAADGKLQPEVGGVPSRDVVGEKPPLCVRTVGTLAPGRSATATCSGTAPLPGGGGRVEVRGTDPLGKVVTAAADVKVPVIAPALSVTKTAAPPMAHDGDQVTWTVTVRNVGDSPLDPVAVADETEPACARTFGALAPGSEQTYSCKAKPTATITNTVTATGTDLSGAPVTATDSATVQVLHPALAVTVTPEPLAVREGDRITYTVTVRNTGDSPLNELAVADDGVSGCVRKFDTLSPKDVQTYQCEQLAPADDLTNTVVATGKDQLGRVLRVTADARVDVIHPAAEVTAVATPAAVREGDQLTFTITVRNSGDADLHDVDVTDKQLPSCARKLGIIAAQGKQTYTCTTVAGTNGFANEIAVTGNDPTGQPVNATTSAAFTVQHPSVSLTASVQGGPFREHDSVRIHVTVKNTGDVPLNGPAITAAPRVGGSPGAMSGHPGSRQASPPTGSRGNSPKTAQEGGSAGVGGGSPDSGQVGGSAGVRGGSPGSGQVGGSAGVRGGSPGSGQVGGSAGVRGGSPGSGQAGGSARTRSSSPGSGSAGGLPGPTGRNSGPGQVDGSGGPRVSGAAGSRMGGSGEPRAGASAERSAGDAAMVGSGGSPAAGAGGVAEPRVDGCVQQHGSLAPGESWAFDCGVTAPGDDVVEGLRVSAGVPVGAPVTAAAEAAVDVIHPAVTITQSAAPSAVRAGETATFTVTATNTGDVELRDSEVADASVPECAKRMGTLAPQAKQTYTCTHPVGDDLTNSATVTGVDPSDRAVAAAASAHVDVIHPAVAVTQTATPDQVREGDQVSFKVTVRNSGDVPLSKLSVVDDRTPGCAGNGSELAVGAVREYSCTTKAGHDGYTNSAKVTAVDPLGGSVAASADAAFTVVHPGLSLLKTVHDGPFRAGDPVTFTLTVTNTGDSSLNGVKIADEGACAKTFETLAAGAKQTYDCTVPAPADDTVSTASVTAAPPAGSPLTATADAKVDVIHPAVTVRPAVSPATARTGDDLAVTVVVTNTGDVPLTSVAVKEPGCAKTFDWIDVHGAETYQCSVKAGPDDFTSTAAVTGNDPTSRPVTDSAGAKVDVIHPEVALMKEAQPYEVRAGETVTFSLLVKNVGDVPLTDVSVVDDRTPSCAHQVARLAPDGEETYQCTAVAGTAGFTNTAGVTGTDPTERTVNASAQASFVVKKPSVAVTKGASGGPFRAGDSIPFEVVVTNTGDQELRDVTVSDDLAPGCARRFAKLPVNGIQRYPCVITAGDGDSPVKVTATPPRGAPVTAVDKTSFDVLRPAVELQRDHLAQPIRPGDPVTYLTTVRNTGDSALHEVTVHDVDGSCSFTLRALAPGAHTTRACTQTVRADTTTPTTVTATDETGHSVTNGTTTTTEVTGPGLTITTAGPSRPVLPGHPTTVTATATNTGDVPLADVRLAGPGCASGPVALAPGAATPKLTCEITAPGTITARGRTDQDAPSAVQGVAAAQSANAGRSAGAGPGAGTGQGASAGRGPDVGEGAGADRGVGAGRSANAGRGADASRGAGPGAGADRGAGAGPGANAGRGAEAARGVAAGHGVKSTQGAGVSEGAGSDAVQGVAAGHGGRAAHGADTSEGSQAGQRADTARDDIARAGAGVARGGVEVPGAGAATVRAVVGTRGAGADAVRAVVGARGAGADAVRAVVGARGAGADTVRAVAGARSAGAGVARAVVGARSAGAGTPSAGVDTVRAVAGNVGAGADAGRAGEHVTEVEVRASVRPVVVRPGLRLIERGDPAAAPGSTVTFVVTAVNTGSAVLIVDGRRLLPGERLLWTRTAVAPGGGTFTDSAKVEAVPEVSGAEPFTVRAGARGQVRSGAGAAALTPRPAEDSDPDVRTYALTSLILLGCGALLVRVTRRTKIERSAGSHCTGLHRR
ncbi:hypothetical protein GCM10022222_16020 [Amycolatopsis ultiminotia]|uniref:DUF7507 domain-containing protein n=1 Tax=Amycolatopsis ultiminotia TaxID=543629 RepID=A0ABP6VCY8_9PSEU